MNRQKNNENEESQDWENVSSWLFEGTENSKYTELICDDFAQTILGIDKKQNANIKNRKHQSGQSSDGIFFANRMVNIFPELRKEIFIEKECYSEFRSTEFIKKRSK